MLIVTHETFYDGHCWQWRVLEDGVQLCTGGMWPTQRAAEKDGAKAAARTRAYHESVA